jgi:hypothetical protein
MRADIVIASYKKDLRWLWFNLQFLAKNWQEPESRIIVRLDRDCAEIIAGWSPRVTDGVQFIYVDPWPDGYHFHMYLKMTADQYTDADLIICLDSDVMLLEPASLHDLMEGGKPVIYYLDWVAAEANAEKKWRAGTSRIMGMDLDRDYMVYTPFTFWRSTFMRTRARIEKVTGKPFKEAVYSERPYDYAMFLNHPMIYADYEALCLFANKHEPDWYVVKPRPSKTWPFRLYWSHGYNDEIALDLASRL